MPPSWQSGATGASSPPAWATARAQGPAALTTQPVAKPPLSVRTPTTLPLRRMMLVTRSLKRKSTPSSAARALKARLLRMGEAEPSSGDRVPPRSPSSRRPGLALSRSSLFSQSMLSPARFWITSRSLSSFSSSGR